MPPHRQWPPPTHTYRRGRPPHPELLRAQRHEQLLAQSLEIDNKQLLLHSYLHPVPQGLSTSDHLRLQIQKVPSRSQNRLHPPKRQPSLSQAPSIHPLPSSFRAQDSSRHLTKSLSSVYLPLDWRTTVPSRPLRKHLPVDALAHLTLPLQEGLTRFPLILHTPPPPGTSLPPPSS